MMSLRILYRSWQEDSGIFTLMIIIFSILNIKFLASCSLISVILVKKSINRNSDQWDFPGFLPYAPIKKKKKQWLFQKYIGTLNAIIELGLATPNLTLQMKYLLSASFLLITNWISCLS